MEIIDALLAQPWASWIPVIVVALAVIGFCASFALRRLNTGTQVRSRQISELPKKSEPGYGIVAVATVGALVVMGLALLI